MSRLTAEVRRRGVVPPTPATLRRYGLTADEWLALLAGQGWKCPICMRKSGVRFVTDHHHLPGWKNLPAEERKRYTRGVLCLKCNWRRVDSDMSAAEAARIAAYLAAYEARRGA